MAKTRFRNAAVVGAVVGAVAMLAACGGEDAAAPDVATVAGSYVLESVNGRGPASGTLVLTPIGVAERRVRYEHAGILSAELVARGSYRVGRDGRVELELREDAGRSSYTWRPRAELRDGVLRLQHPDPADGPDIVESYRRR